MIRVRIRKALSAWLVIGTAFLWARALGSASTPNEDKIPPLLPPHDEIPPDFWELHLWQVVIGSVALLALIAVLVWWLLKPRPVEVIPAAVKARDALKPLAEQPETGPVLIRVSQVVRGYFAAAFGLPGGELTTGEFTRAVKVSERAAPELASAAIRFLRACDERKFAPSPPAAPLGAVSEALRLIDLAEAQRLRASESAEMQPSGTRLPTVPAKTSASS